MTIRTAMIHLRDERFGEAEDILGLGSRTQSLYYLVASDRVPGVNVGPVRSEATVGAIEVVRGERNHCRSPASMDCQPMLDSTLPVPRMKEPIPGLPVGKVVSVAWETGVPFLNTVMTLPLISARITLPFAIGPVPGPVVGRTVKSPTGPFHRTI